MIALKKVKSTAVKAFGYDPATRTLAVRFWAGHVLHYADVPQSVADKFEDHESKGRAVGELLRGKFEHSIVPDEQEEVGA